LSGEGSQAHIRTKKLLFRCGRLRHDDPPRARYANRTLRFEHGSSCSFWQAHLFNSSLFLTVIWTKMRQNPVKVSVARLPTPATKILDLPVERPSRAKQRFLLTRRTAFVLKQKHLGLVTPHKERFRRRGIFRL
jgi:hypothetical protein